MTLTNWSSQTLSWGKDEVPVVGLMSEFPEPLISTWVYGNTLFYITVYKYIPGGKVALGNTEQSGNLNGLITCSNNGHNALHVTVLTSSHVSCDGKYKFPVLQSQRGKTNWQRKGALAALQAE